MVKIKALLLTLIVAANLSASGMKYGEWRWVDLGSGETPAEAVELIPSFTYSDLTFQVRINGFYRQDIEVEGQKYERIYLPGGSRSAEVGLPELPAIGRWFAVPRGADVSVEWTVIKADTLRDVMVFPAQPQPVDDPSAPDPEFTINSSFYQQDTLYPAALAEISPASTIRGVEVRNVLTMPFKYNPLKKELVIVREATVHVVISGGGQLYEPRLVSPYFRQFFADYLVNYPLIADAFEHRTNLLGLNTSLSVKNVTMPTNAADLLIIVPDDLYDSILPLALHHHHQGIITKVVRLSEIGSNPSAEEIRQFIINAYNNWEIPPSFVLVVGDADMIPTFYKHVHPYENIYTAADVYYGEMDDISQDSIPMQDIFAGRLSVDNAMQLGVVVRKIIKYESDPAQPYDWLNSMLLAAYNESGRYFVYTSEAIYNYLNPMGYNIDRQYENGNPPGNTQGVIDAINNGVWLVNHRDHGDSRNGGGSFDGWAHPRLTTEHMGQLYNGDMTPVVFSLNCRTGWFDGETDQNSGSYECIAEEFVRVPHAGAVASMGLSRVSYSGYNDEIDRGLIDALFPGFDPNYPNDTTTNQYETPLPYIGGVLNYAKLWMYDKYYLPGGCSPYPWTPDHEKTLVEFEEFTLLGDPAMRVRTAIPDSFMVNYPVTVPIGPSSVIVTVEDGSGNPVANALVALVQSDTLVLARGTTDEFGNVTLEIEPLNADEITLTVTGYNFLPFVASVQPISEGPYVGYRGFILNDTTGGNGNGAINPDETVQLSVLARNFGNDTAYSVTATLATDDSLVTVTQPNSNYGDMAPDDSLYGEPPFEIAVDHDAPDGHVIRFSVTFTDANDSSWVSRFSARVLAPMLVYSNQWVMDTINGNGNSVSEPGETIALFVEVENVGHQALDSVQVTISCDSAYLNIIQPTAYFGLIDSQATAINAEPFVIEIDSSAPAPSFPIVHLNIVGANGFQYEDSLTLIVGRTGIFETFEDSTSAALWTHSGNNDAWHLTTLRAHSGSYSYFFGVDGGAYPNGADASLVSPIVVLGVNPELSFWTWYSTESGYDYGYVEISTDGGNTWQELTSINGSSGGWVEVNVPLTDYNPGTVAYLRFRFHSDGSVNREGWYIDDVIVTPPAPPAHIALNNFEIIDTLGNNNGLIDPGEMIWLLPEFRNIGGTGTSNLTITMSTDNQYVQLIDSVSTVRALEPDSSAVVDSAFVFQVAPETPNGTYVDAVFHIVDDMGFSQDIEFRFVVGDERAIPSGPDSYGYMAYDPNDPGGIEFEWIEVDPNSGGFGTALNLGDDDTRTVTLPFQFVFYGQPHNMISICSNGWIAMGTTSSRSFSNRNIPNTSEPNDMIAGVWDDLNPRTGGTVAYGYDSLKHVFVIEWNNVAHYGSSSSRETFEIILYDPTYYPTATGDGPIAVMYKTEPSQNDYTVGIENSQGTIGLQYYYDGTIDPHGFPITDSFALYFSTGAPSVDEGEFNRPLTLELAPAFPNPVKGVATINFALPQRTNIDLSVYDITGRRVATLASGVYKAGRHTVRWNGTDDSGRKLPAGLYIYRLKTPDKAINRKLILLK